jgi:hypothetical protein
VAQASGTSWLHGTGAVFARFWRNTKFLLRRAICINVHGRDRQRDRSRIRLEVEQTGQAAAEH